MIIFRDKHTDRTFLLYIDDYHDDHIEIMMMMIMIILKDKNDTWGSNSPLRQGVEGARVLRSVMTDTPW